RRAGSVRADDTRSARLPIGRECRGHRLQRAHAKLQFLFTPGTRDARRAPADATGLGARLRHRAPTGGPTMNLRMLMCVTLLCASGAQACDEDENRMTTVEEVRRVLVEGMPAEEVERFFIEQHLEYSIVRGKDLDLFGDLQDPHLRAGVHARYLGI